MRSGYRRFHLADPACTGELKSQTPGDPAKGKEAFETRGCMACHSMGEGNDKQGGTFAANLSRVGEKDNYDYLVRWIHNPRERTAPYCPFEKKDLTAEDYKTQGLAVTSSTSSTPGVPTTGTSWLCSR